MSPHRWRQFGLAVSLAVGIGPLDTVVIIGGANKCECGKPGCRARWFRVTGYAPGIEYHSGAWVVG